MDGTDRQKSLRKIIGSFETIKKLIKEKAICEENRIILFDPPFTLHILKNQECISLYHDDEEIAFISPLTFRAVDHESERILEEWLKTLTSFGFRRYILKKRKTK